MPIVQPPAGSFMAASANKRTFCASSMHPVVDAERTRPLSTGTGKDLPVLEVGAASRAQEGLPVKMARPVRPAHRVQKGISASPA